MKSSVIRHPESSYFIRRCDWQIKALQLPSEAGAIRKGSAAECAAEIMSIMEYHYNNRMANRKLRAIVSVAMFDERKSYDQIGEWLPYSISYLVELLLNGRGKTLITDALNLLIERKFLSDNPPADLVANFPTHSSWYRLEVDEINRWIDENIRKSWIDGHRREKIDGKMNRPSRKETSIEVDPITRQANTLAEFYKHIHAKNSNFVFDATRRNMVVKQLKSNRTMGQCAQAIIGNVCSDWHQGKVPDNNKIFDDLDLMFRNAKKFEMHLGYALDAGVTEQTALNELEAFLRGETSRYAKRPKKTAQSGTRQQITPVNEPRNAHQYVEFARTIAPFFTADMANSEIMEFCVTNDGLIKIAGGIIQQDYLIEQISKGVCTFRPNGPTDEMAKQISEFAGTFCKQQLLNSGD